MGLDLKSAPALDEIGGPLPCFATHQGATPAQCQLGGASNRRIRGVSRTNDIAPSPTSKPAPGEAAPRELRPACINLGDVNGKPEAAPIKLTPELLRARSKPVPTVDPAVQHAWHEAAPQLAAWVSQHLVNTTRGCGGYAVYEDDSIEGTTHKYAPDLARLTRHFRAASARDVIGLHATVRDVDGTCRSRWTGIDIDKHDDTKGDGAANLKLALAVHDRARAAGFTPLLSQSDGKGGYHVLILHAGPIEAMLARAFGLWLVRGWEMLGAVREPEAFPKQDEVGPDGWGNWLRVFGHHHKRAHYSRFLGRVDLARRPGRDRLHPGRHARPAHIKHSVETGLVS